MLGYKLTLPGTTLFGTSQILAKESQGRKDLRVKISQCVRTCSTCRKIKPHSKVIIIKELFIFKRDYG